MNDPQFRSFLMLSFKMILSSSGRRTCDFSPPRTFIHLLHSYSTMHTEADRGGGNKLREKSRANWLSRDKTHHPRKWQVCGPELEKKRALKGNGQRDRHSSHTAQSRDALPALLLSGLSGAHV